MYRKELSGGGPFQGDSLKSDEENGTSGEVNGASGEENGASGEEKGAS